MYTRLASVAKGPGRGGSAVASVVAVLCSLGAVQEVAGDTLWMPVTYYDYRADGTNPDFEPAGYTESGAGLRMQMVQPYLDAERKPLLLMDQAYNEHVEEWFRPSGTGPEAVFSVADDGHCVWSGLTGYQGRTGEYVGQAFSATDFMACVVIYDSLPFVPYDSLHTGVAPLDDASLLGRRAYACYSPEFFPVDSSGFGADPASYPAYGWTNDGNHNYSFAMEMHALVVWSGDDVLLYRGDDDAWAFIGNQKISDMGGIHRAMSTKVNLSSMGLVSGSAYTFDFFATERHVAGSEMLLVSTLLRKWAPTPPDSVTLHVVQSCDTLSVGDTCSLSALVMSSGTPQSDWAADTRWEILSGSSVCNLTAATGSQTTLVANQTGHCVVRVSACNPVDCAATMAADTLVVTVFAPSIPYRLWIEPDTAVDSSSLHSPNEIGQISLSGSHDSVQVCAVIRDLYGNFVRYASPARIRWEMVDSAIAMVAPHVGRPWAATISQGGYTPGTTWCIAVEEGVSSAAGGWWLSLWTAQCATVCS